VLVNAFGFRRQQRERHRVAADARPSMTTAPPSGAVGSVQIWKAAFFSTCHASAQDVLAGRERPFTAPAYGLLVGRARRFTSLVTQMHVEVCGALQPEASARRPCSQPATARNPDLRAPDRRLFAIPRW